MQHLFHSAVALTAVQVIDAGTDNFEYSLFLNQSMCWINLLVNQGPVAGNTQIQQ